jgi:hypothetical protein
VPEGVVERLGAVPLSGIVLEVGEHPSSAYLGFLVAIALLGRWRGVVTLSGDPAVLSSKALEETSATEHLLQRFCGARGAS